MAATVQLTDIQKVTYQLVAVDADGNPAVLAAGATVAVAAADPTIALVTPDATPAAGSVASGVIAGQSKLGTVQVTATVTNADGSAGPTGSLAVTVVASAAASISFNVGTPA